MKSSDAWLTLGLHEKEHTDVVNKYSEHNFSGVSETCEHTSYNLWLNHPSELANFDCHVMSNSSFYWDHGFGWLSDLQWCSIMCEIKTKQIENMTVM